MILIVVDITYGLPARNKPLISDNPDLPGHPELLKALTDQCGIGFVY
jgi:hypothetical protein